MRYTKFFLILGVFGVLVLVYISGIYKFFTLEHLKAAAYELRAYIYEYPYLSVVLFCLVCFFAVVFSLPWAALLSVAAGYLFGLQSMFFLVPVFAAGAIVSFLMTRALFAAYVRGYWAGYLKLFDEEITRYGGWYLLAIRFIPIFPFFLVNTVAALTPISLRVYSIATFFGIIPPTGVFVFAGTQLALVNTISDILSARVLGALGLLAGMVLVPLLYRRFFSQWE